jgi:hypothetical protein
MLAGLLKMAGMGQDDEHMHDMTDNDSQMLAIQTMGDEEACSSCGSSPCGCDSEEMYEGLASSAAKIAIPGAAMAIGSGLGALIDKLSTDSSFLDSVRAAVKKVDQIKGTGTQPTQGTFKDPADGPFARPMDEAYGDTDASENDPDYPTDQEGTDDAMMYSGGLNGPKSTGQTTIPVIAGQDDRMGYNGDNELRRMMKIAGLR